MKNTFLFYLIIVLPLVLLLYLAVEGYSMGFAIGIIVYALIYRPLTDYFRLKSKRNKEDVPLARFFIPFYSIRWFREIHF